MFGVDGATARFVDPAASGTIDVNVLNNRNWVDVTFAAPTAPAGLRIDIGSITDLAPEFVLAGAGLGSLALDAARAPTLLTETATSASFRYWLTGVRGTGAIALTHLAGTWSYNVAALDNTTTTATATISGGNAPDTIAVTLPTGGVPPGFLLDPQSVGLDAFTQPTRPASPTARAGRSCSTRCARPCGRARATSG